MILYQFICTNCNNETEEMFPVLEYEKRIADDGRLKYKKCEECGTLSIYRHITQAPQVMGGTSGYQSMERYWQQNPDIAKRKEEELNKKLNERHRKKVLDKIDKQARRYEAEKRGQGYKEDRTSIDE